MSKLAIKWYDQNGVLVVREFEASIAASQVLQGYATFVSPNADTERALNAARDREAERPSTEARGSEDTGTLGLNFLKGPDRLERAQALLFGMRGKRHE